MEAFLKTGKLGASSGGINPATKSRAAAAGESGGGGARAPPPKPWVEKYRPKTVTDVAYQDDVVAVLKKSLEGADIPNLLFYGPPGTGKTSTILAAARDLFGSDLYRERVLELNASDERGIAVVRDKVKRFAQLTASGRRPDGRACPPYKIIILDEADSMTRDAQSALRRTMEKEGRSTKFCLICNYISRIIEPLTSRCAKFRFKPLSRPVLIGRLESIASAECAVVSDEAFGALVETSEGDLRKAITSLQSCARLKKEGECVEKLDVYEISGVIPDEWLRRLVAAIRSNSYEKVETVVDELMSEGFSALQLCGQIHDWVTVGGDHDLSDHQKSMICSALAISEHCLLEGANEYLQIMDVCSTMMKAMASGA